MKLQKYHKFSQIYGIFNIKHEKWNKTYKIRPL